MFSFRSKIITNEEKVKDILTRGVEEVIEKDNLKKKLLSGKSLRVKLGIDPTSKNIHLGRSIPLLKLKDFQDLGHTIVFIIGDFTGQIGDTSDKESERPMISEKEIKENLKDYIGQAGKILNIGKCEIFYNSEWLKKINYAELGKQADVFSLSDFNSRENIKRRLDAGKRVSLRELLYPLMQGYDSVVVKADVEIGGTDQKFNLLAGRDLQRLYKQEPQDILTLSLVEGLDGRKMSSSWGNTINITDGPKEMFGKVMALNDGLIVKYATLVTRMPTSRIKEMEEDINNGGNPKKAKTELAKEIVRMYHGNKNSKIAEEEFEKIFSKGEFPSDAIIIQTKKEEKLADVLVENNILDSKSEFRRLLDAGAISDYSDKKISDPNEIVGQERKVKIGKKIFVVLRPK